MRTHSKFHFRTYFSRFSCIKRLHRQKFVLEDMLLYTLHPLNFLPNKCGKSFRFDNVFVNLSGGLMRFSPHLFVLFTHFWLDLTKSVSPGIKLCKCCLLAISSHFHYSIHLLGYDLQLLFGIQQEYEPTGDPAIVQLQRPSWKKNSYLQCHKNWLSSMWLFCAHFRRLH